jgi:ribonuclease HII
MPLDFSWESVFALVTRRGSPKLRDSKQLSAQQREILYEHIVSHGALRHAAALVSADTIDAIGIANAAREAAAKALDQLGVSPGKANVLLDAGLSVSGAWEQESFVKGDERIPAIALASIVAKVSRDRHMDELSLEHVHYGFDQHKGYGTRAHYQAIHTHGMSTLHRRTFVHV